MRYVYDTGENASSLPERRRRLFPPAARTGDARGGVTSTPDPAPRVGRAVSRVRVRRSHALSNAHTLKDTKNWNEKQKTRDVFLYDALRATVKCSLTQS